MHSLTTRSNTHNNIRLPESETWDYVIADAGLAGVIAAGELALKDNAVLIVEPRTALGAECTRSKCPVGSLLTQPNAGAFLGLVEKIAKEMVRRPEDIENQFLLEIVLEKAFLEAGGQILYGATPCSVCPRDKGSALALEVATKSGKLCCSASRDILVTSLRQGAQCTVIHGLLIIGARNSVELRGTLSFHDLALSYRIPPADGFGRTQVWLSWTAPAFDLWEAEKVLGQSVLPFIQNVRARHDPLADAEIVYFWDEPIAFVDGNYLREFRWVEACPSDGTCLKSPGGEPAVPPLNQIEHLASNLGIFGLALVEKLCSPSFVSTERVQ